MTNKEIGRRLGISDMTVKTHAHNIFHKLEISGRMHLFGLSNAREIQASLPPEARTGPLRTICVLSKPPKRRARRSDDAQLVPQRTEDHPTEPAAA